LLLLTLEPHSISSEASRIFVKMKQDYVQMYQKGLLNNFNVQTKNSSKPNDVKQFTMLNILSRRSKFPDKIKNLTCSQRIKFLKFLY